MNRVALFLRLTVAVAPLVLAATPALAQDTTAPVAAPAGEAAEKPFSFDLTLYGATDYRFRGLSLSDKDPAFQPSITVTHKSGIYASVWGSNIASNGGDNIEIDLTAGISKDVGNGITAGVLAVYYLYPGASGDNYVEFQSSLSKTLGPVKVGVSAAYAPKQSNIGDLDNVYVALNGSVGIPSTPLTLNASVGYEDGAFGDKKKDWSLGVSAEVKGFTLGLSYIDTAHTNSDPLGKATAVFSLSRTF
jgi:uncharacterized protein (TIGR02001 family)